MKYCRKCGLPLYDEAALCPRCGVPCGGQNYNPYGAPANGYGPYGQRQCNGCANCNGHMPAPYIPPVNPYPAPYPREIASARGRATAAMICGILSILVAYVGLALGIVALALGIPAAKSLKRLGRPSGPATAGFVCGIIGAALWTFVIIVAICA